MPDYKCMVCGHEFDAEGFCVEPEECPDCESTDFLSMEEYQEYQRVNARDDVLQGRKLFRS